MKKTTVEHFCDRCGDKFEKRNSLIIENMTYTASGYDDRGSGGMTHKDKEFCGSCSSILYEFFNPKK